MKIAIVYGTKYGCTKKCSEILAESIHVQSALYNLSKKEMPVLDEFDMVIVGGSIYAGRVRKEVLSFIEDYKELLLRKKLVLFTCNMHRGEDQQKQLQASYPKELMMHAEALVSFGGRFDFSQLNFLEKAVIKKIAHVSSDLEEVDIDSIKNLAEQINNLDFEKPDDSRV